MATLTRRLVTIIAIAALTIGALACEGADKAKRRFLADGDKAMAAGQADQAIINYRNAIKKDSNFGEAHLKLSEAYGAAKNFAASYKELLRAADLMPEDNTVQIKAGGYLLVARQFEDAQTRAQKVLDRDPKNIDALILLGDSLAGLKDLDGAISQVQEAIALDPSRESSYANMAVLLYGKGAKKEAGEAFQKAIDASPQSVSARLAMANYDWAIGDVKGSEQVLTDTLKIAPENAQANRALALIYMMTNRVAEAEKPLTIVAASDPSAKLGLADYYLGTKRTDDAVKILTDLAAKPQTMAPAKTRLAEIQYGLGKRADAHLMLSQILTEQPKNVDVLVTEARWFMAESKLDDAFKSATTAAAAEPTAVAPKYLLGLIHASRDQMDEAAQSLESVLETNPRAVAAKVQLARVYMAQGKMDQALQMSQEVITAQPNYLLPRVVHARTLLVKGDMTAGEKEVRDMKAKFPASAQIANLEAVVALGKKDTVGARKSFEQALKMDPSMVEAFAGLVTLDVITKRPGDATAKLEAAMTANRSNRDVLLLAGKTYMMMRDFPKAEEVLRRLIDLDSSHLTAYELLAQVYVAENKMDEALTHYEEAARRQPKSVGLQTIVAILLHSQNRIGDAVKQYEVALQLDPTAPVASNNLAWILADKGEDLDRAQTLAQQAADKLKDDPRVNDTLGWVYIKKHLPLLAVPVFQKCVTADPQNSLFHYHLGLALADAGEPAKARQSLEQALKLDPKFDGSDDARRVLGTLKG